MSAGINRAEYSRSAGARYRRQVPGATLKGFPCQPRKGGGFDPLGIDAKGRGGCDRPWRQPRR